MVRVFPAGACGYLGGRERSPPSAISRRLTVNSHVRVIGARGPQNVVHTWLSKPMTNTSARPLEEKPSRVSTTLDIPGPTQLSRLWEGTGGIASSGSLPEH